MKLLADKDERFKGLFTKVSIFVLIAVVAVSLNLLISGIKKGFFTAKSPINFVASSGQDIKVGMPVKLSGFKIGVVSKLELDSKARAQVEMMIEDRYLSMLKEDAEVSLQKEGVIGDSFLEASRGSDSKKNLSAGAEIKFERGGGLEQIANELRARLYPALDEANQLLKNVNDPKGDVRQTLGNVRQFTAELQGTRARIDQLLGQINEGVEKDVRPTLFSVKQSAGQLPAMVRKVDESLENLRQATATINATVEKSAPQVSGFLGETRGLMSDTRNVMDSVSNSWPLKTIMQPAEQGMVRMDSHD